MKEEVDFNIFKAQILEEIKAGKPLFGKDGALAPMIENIVNAVLEGEMDAHLTRESRESGNRRNGKMQKQVQTPVGDITVTTPRDRDASFDPQFIKKRETMLSEGMADRIIGLYALGTSTRDISNWLEETVGTSISAETIRKLIYTTNTVEGYHRQIRRAQRTRVFSRTTLPWSNSSTWRIATPVKNGLCLSLTGALSHSSLR